MSLVVLCPSRGRPEKLRECAASLVETRGYGSTRMIGIFDHDDPAADEYANRAGSLYDFIFPVHDGGGTGMVSALNAGVKQLLREHPEIEILGFVGDDHRFRTSRWDEVVTAKLEQRRGFAYADDKFRRDGDIPTQIFISREIVEALGWMALPDLKHLYVDNSWRVLADHADARYYLPEIVIEHMHPLNGKAQWDEGYRRVNAQSLYNSDEAAFQAWLASPRLAADIKKVRRAIGTTISTR